eukprot:921913_1
MADLQDTPLVTGTGTVQPNSKVAGSFKSPTPASLSIRNVEAGAPETGGAKANIGWLRSQKLRRSVNAFCSRKCNRWFFPIAVMVYTIIAISVFWAVWARLTNQSLELIIRQQQTGLINRTSFISNSIYAPPLLMLRRAAVTFEALEVDTADLNTQRTDILQFFQKNIRNSDASGLFFANSAGDFLGAFRLSDNSEFYLTKDAADQKFLRLTTPDGVGSPTDLPLIADLTLEKWFTNVQNAPVSVTKILQPMQFSRLRGRIFSEPFPVVSSSSPRGVFGVEFPLSSFSRELGKLKISSEGLVFMVDTQTNVLFSSSVPNLEDEYGVTAASESRNMLIREAFKKYQTKNPTGTSGTLSGDELRLSFLSESDPSGEYIRFAVLPIDAYERPVRVAGTINGVFGIFCILLAILISWLSFKVVPSRIQLEKARIEEENALTPDPLGINNRVSIPPDRDFLARLGLLKSESHIEIPDEVEGEIVTTHLSPKHHIRRGCLACLLPDDQDDLAARSSRVIGLMTAASILLLLMLVSIMAAWFAISEQAVTGKSASTRLELQTRLFGGLEAYLGFAEDTLQSLQAAPNSLYSNSNCQTFFSESLRSSGLTNRKSDEVQVTSVFAVLADESVCGAILNPETGTDILTVRRSAQQPSLTDKCVKIFDSTNQSQSMLCSFDPFSSLWYTNTVSNSEINWSTDASGLSSLPNIVVVSQRIESDDGSVLGVLGAEISLDYFSSYLQTLHVNPSKGGIRSNDFRIFVITPDYQLLSSSMAQTTPDCGSRCILQNSNADTVIETTSEFLQRDDTSPKLAEITEPQEIPRTIENPLTFIGPVKNSGWFGIITLSRQDVFNNNRTLTFLIAAFVTIITVVSSTFSFTRWRFDVDEELKQKSIVERTFGVVDISEEGLEVLLQRIRREVLRAYRHSWKRLYPNGYEDPTDEYRSHRAVSHVEAAASGHNLLRFCLLDRPELGVRPLRAYWLLSFWAYKWTVYAVAIAYISLPLWKRVSNADLKENGVITVPYALEAACLMVLLFDLVARIYVLFNESKVIKHLDKEELTDSQGGIQHKPEHRRVSSRISDSLGISQVNFLSEPYIPHVYFLRTILMVFLVWNWAVSGIFLWNTEFYFPVRPFLLILMSRRIRDSAHTFMKTIISATDVFILLFASVLVAAVIGLSLFQEIVNPDQVSSGYDNYVRSVITSFVYLITGENFPDVVYPAIEFNPLSLVYFLSWTVFVLFFLVGMLTGFFQDGFTVMQQTDLRKRKLYDRVGITAAFILLDFDGNGFITRNEFKDFMKSIRPDATEDHINKLFEFLNFADDDERLDVKEFVDGVEEITIQRLVGGEDDCRERWYPLVFLRYAVFETVVWDQVTLVVLLLNIMTLSLHGVSYSSRRIDSLAVGFLLFFAAETLLRIGAFGFREFWNWAYYHNPGLFQMFSNRSDFVFMVSSLTAFFIGVGSTGGLDYVKNPLFRVAFCIPVLRLFTQVKRLRYLVFTLIQILPLFASLATLLLVVFYVYGFIGMAMFSGKFQVLDGGVPEANFDSLPRTMVTLLQLMIGEGWHEVMYNAILATDFSKAWYFITFIILVHVLFINLFIGLVLSIFSILVSGDNKSKELSSKELE